MPITTEVDWLVCVEPYDFARFCQGRLRAERLHPMIMLWGERIRHLLGTIARGVFDAYAEWVRTGCVGPRIVPDDLGFEGMLRHWGAEPDTEGFASSLRHGDWLRAMAGAADAASWGFPRPGETPSDPAHSHKKKSKKAKAEIEAARREGRERYDRGRDAHRERTLWQFANEFRDVAGNPFRPVAFDPAWRTETVGGLAAGIDEAGSYERMPILADALQEAGCEDEQVLSHARGPGPHVRGCWLIDMILGRWQDLL